MAISMAISTGVAAMLLCADFALHHSPALLRFRIARTLRAPRLPTTTRADPLHPLPACISRLPPFLSVLPRATVTLLTGASGSGKSTEMARITRELIFPAPDSGVPPTPAVYTRYSQIKSPESVQTFAVATKRLSTAAEQLYEHIGFPTRVSCIAMMARAFRGLKLLNAVTLEQYDEREAALEKQDADANRDRFAEALRLLFQVAEQLYVERKKAGIAEEHAPIVMLFDDVQDLVKTKRLASVGGRFVLDQLLALLVEYCVNRGVVRAVVAGSPSEVAIRFEEREVARDLRYNHYEMEDRALDTIIQALIKRGYSAEEAHSMVDLVGRRLSLLMSPMQLGATHVSCTAFLAKSRTMAKNCFSSLLNDPAVPSKARTNLLDILQRIVEHEAGHGPAPQWGDMCKPLQDDLHFAKVLYVRTDRTLTFQSQLHRNVWRELRSKYVHHLPAQ